MFVQPFLPSDDFLGNFWHQFVQNPCQPNLPLGGGSRIGPYVTFLKEKFQGSPKTDHGLVSNVWGIFNNN